jgi:hypothetical protein
MLAFVIMPAIRHLLVVERHMGQLSEQSTRIKNPLGAQERENNSQLTCLFTAKYPT